MKSIKFSLQRKFTAGLFLVSLLVLNVPAQTGLSSDEKKLTKSIKIKTIERITKGLADDKFEGRGTLQRGGDMAANWIADQMKAMGLKPLGDNGTYLQSVPLVATEFTDDARVTLNGENLVYGTDWSAATLLADMNVEAKMIFVGHGVVSDQIGRNDLKDADVRGKIAVLIQGPPREYSDQKWTEITDKALPIQLVLQRGAVGVILVTND